MFVLGNETDDFVRYCLKGIFCVCSLLAGECVSGLIDALCYIHWRSSRLVSIRLIHCHSVEQNHRLSHWYFSHLVQKIGSVSSWFHAMVESDVCDDVAMCVGVWCVASAVSVTWPRAARSPAHSLSLSTKTLVCSLEMLEIHSPELMLTVL